MNFQEFSAKVARLGSAGSSVSLVNRPVRAFINGLLWALAALSLSFYPLGFVSLLLSGLGPPDGTWAYVLSNIAGLLLSGLLTWLLLAVVAVVLIPVSLTTGWASQLTREDVDW